MNEIKAQMERDSYLDAQYHQQMLSFNYNSETFDSSASRTKITSSELEMTCRRINQPGGVQPWGCFLLVQTGSTKVIACSANTLEFIGVEASEVVWSDVTDMFLEGARLKQHILEGEGKRVIQATPKPPRKSGGGGNGVNFDDLLPPINLIIMQGAQGVSIDMEPIVLENRSLADDPDEVAASIGRLAAVKTKQELRQTIANEIQRLAGYERVMCYMFHEDQHGEVVAEATSMPNVRSYHGLHFPATDIPQRARDLFLLNKARIIVDSTAKPVSLVCLEDSPVDVHSIILSNSTTRAVHPAHLEYLVNWGVKATLVLSVRVNGKLWGLICCNHEESTRFMSYAARMGCASVVDAFALRLTEEVDELLRKQTQLFVDSTNALVDGVNQAKKFDPLMMVNPMGPNLLDVIEDTDGAAIVTQDGQTFSVGVVPEASQLVALAAWRLSSSGLEVTTNLKVAYLGPVDDAVCGMLSTLLINGSVVMWFRKENVVDVSWTGNPNECKTRIPGSTFLPQNSFDTFVETQKGRCKTWTMRSLEFASQFGSMLDVVWSDLSQRCVLTVSRRSGKTKLVSRKICDELQISAQQAIGNLFAKICPMSQEGLIDGIASMTANGPHDMYIRLSPPRLHGRWGASRSVELYGVVQQCRDPSGETVILFVGDRVAKDADRNPLAATLDELLSGQQDKDKSGGMPKQDGMRSMIAPHMEMQTPRPLEIPHQLNVLNKVRVPCWLMETNPQSHRFVWGNHVACQCFGKSIEEFVCMDLSDAQVVETLDLQDWHRKVTVERSTVTSRKTFYVEKCPVTFDLEVQPIPAVFPGETETKVLALVVGIPVLLHDVGQIESGRSHEMLQQSRVLTLLFSIKGSLIQANVAARAHYCLESDATGMSLASEGGDAVGMTMQSFFESCVWDSKEEMEKCMAEMYRQCASINMGSYEFEALKTSRGPSSNGSKDGNGTEPLHLIKFFFARDPLSGERCILVNEIDISQAKCVQVDMIMSKHKQEQFLASVSHELRTPLNGIMGLSESLIADKTASDATKKTVSIIMASAHRLTTLVNDILDMTSSKESTFVLSYDTVDLKDVADHVIECIKPMVSRNVTLINNVPENLPKFVCDAGRLSQILTNLIGNSVKFTHKGSIRVFANHGEGSKNITITVQDTGIGIEPRLYAKIFQPFMKGDMTSKWNYGGSGLGLSVVKTLVDAMGGFINIESNQDPVMHGSTFTVQIPMTPSIKRNLTSSDAKLASTEKNDVLPQGMSGSLPVATSGLPLTRGSPVLNEPGPEHQAVEEELHKGAVLLLQVGTIIMLSGEDVVGEYASALIAMHEAMNRVISDNGAVLALSRGDEYTIVLSANCPLSLQVSKLRNIAVKLIKQCHQLKFTQRTMSGDPVESCIIVRAAMSVGQIQRGVLISRQEVAYGPAVEKAWDLLNVSRPMCVHYPEEAIDWIKEREPDCVLTLDARTLDQTTQTSIPGRTFFENLSGEDALMEPKMDSNSLTMGWAEGNRQGGIVDKRSSDLASFASGLCSRSLQSQNGQARNEIDLEKMHEVLTHHEQLRSMLLHLMAERDMNNVPASCDLVSQGNDYAKGIVIKPAPACMKTAPAKPVARLGTGAKVSRPVSHIEHDQNMDCSHIEIMSVDDDPINQMVIENLLAPYGYTVTMCVHGMQCLEVLESRDYPPDLLLLDIMMPHVSGYEVCEKLREKYTRIELPIIMISAKVDTESVSKCIELGSNDFVHKPFHRRELLSRIKAQLELKAMMQVQVDYQLSSNMLRLMMPDDVAHRVLNGESTILDSFDDATYVFAEVVAEGGCKRVDGEIVAVMNSLSVAFEEICHNNDMIKVERNGSNILMAVADSDKHALRAIHMAIDLVEQSRHIGNSKCFFRVAINSGSSKAAVMGDKMSNYCFLGEDVSQACLLLNLALPNMIVVSAKTRSMLKNHDDLQFLQLEDDYVVGNGLALKEAYCVVDDNVEWNGALGFKKKCGANEMGGVFAGISEDDQEKEEHASDRGESETGSQHHSPMADAFRSNTFDFGGFHGQEGGLSPRGRNALRIASGMAFRSLKLADRHTPSAVAESDDAKACRELRKLLESRDSQLNDLNRRFEELKRSNVSSPAKTNSNQLQCYASDTVNDDGPSFSSGGSGSTQMCDFLTRIRMRSKVSTFQDVGLCSVADLVDLSESEMARVGIVHLGEQVRLRRSAQLWIQSVQAGLIEALPIE